MFKKEDEAFASPPVTCECIKKIEFPAPYLITGDESECYGEIQPQTFEYERAFRLPGLLELNEEITDYWKVAENDLSLSFERMAQVFPTLNDYEENLLSFWILDVLIEALGTAQSSNMSFSHQKATLLWIAYLFNHIQTENPTRKQLFNQLKLALFQGEGNEGEEEGNDTAEEKFKENTQEQATFQSSRPPWDLPLPPILYIRARSKASSETNQEGDEEASGETISKEGTQSSVTLTSEKVEENDEVTNLQNMKIILEILYRIFGQLYAYLQIQSIFHSMPSVEKYSLPFTLRPPKQLLRSESQSKIWKRLSTPEELEQEKRVFDCILPLESSKEIREFYRMRSGEKAGFLSGKDEKPKK